MNFSRLSGALILVLTATATTLGPRAFAMDLSDEVPSTNVEIQFLPSSEWLAQNCKACLVTVKRQALWREWIRHFRGQEPSRFVQMTISGLPSTFNELTETQATLSVYIPGILTDLVATGTSELACEKLLPAYPKTLDMQMYRSQELKGFSTLRIKCGNRN